MAITLQASTYRIYVPKADLTVIEAPTFYQLDVDWFRLQLRNLEDDEEGMALPKTHIHNTEVSFGGLAFARQVIIIPPWLVEFEDGQYQVSCSGANHNIADRRIFNQVSINPNNSAGLVDAGLTTEQATMLSELHLFTGLLSGSPLTVSQTQRQAGGITQTINESGGTVTVTRT